jgi:hypothetical protein
MCKVAAFMALAGAVTIGVSTIYAETFLHIAKLFPG